MLASPAADLQHLWRERSPAVNRLFGFPKPPLALLHREGLGSHPLGLAPGWRWDWWVKFSPNALDGLSSSSRALARFSLQEARSHSVLPPVAAAAASGARRKVAFPFWQLFLPGEIRCPERCLQHSFPLVITLNGQKRGFGRPSTDRATGRGHRVGASGLFVPTADHQNWAAATAVGKILPLLVGTGKRTGPLPRSAQHRPLQGRTGAGSVCVFDVAQKWQAVPSNGLDSSTLWGGGEIPSCKLFHDPPRQFQAATALTPPVPCRPLTNQPAD